MRSAAREAVLRVASFNDVSWPDELTLLAAHAPRKPWCPRRQGSGDDCTATQAVPSGKIYSLVYWRHNQSYLRSSMIRFIVRSKPGA